MGRPLVTACMFCLMCATHAHCSSSHETNNNLFPTQSPKNDLNDGGGGSNGFPLLGSIFERSDEEPTSKRRPARENEDFVKTVFDEFGNGVTIDKEGFERLLQSLNHGSSLDSLKDNNKHNGSSTKNSSTTIECTSVETLIGQAEIVTMESYRDLCPKLVHQLVKGKPCIKASKGLGISSHSGTNEFHSHDDINEDTPGSASLTAVWVYASISVIMISLCGLLAVAIIPLMRHGIYHSLLQFLVALAVGTLCGDALLHLLPHAMMSLPNHDHSIGDAEMEESHNTNLWRGLVAASAIVFFYFTEKCLSLVAEWRKKKQRKRKGAGGRVRVMREEGGGGGGGGGGETRVGEKLCKHKYSSYPYCYGEIADNPESHANDRRQNSEGYCEEMNGLTREENGATKPIVNSGNERVGKGRVESSVDCQEKEHGGGGNWEKEPLDSSSSLERRGSGKEYTTVILREHETRHHGHAHTHGHVHSAPRSLGSVAWMVVLGDGLHNFTDGLAIGAAFAANIGGGVSTAVAVFCHELPHELGDFAVLLKAGMSAKQAVFYNLLSSVLCLFGMCLGVILGHSPQTTFWVFAGAAGMFLYIALVDMIPELTSSHSTEGGSVLQGLLQLAGLVTGISIMLLIALYEHDLRNAFKDSF